MGNAHIKHVRTDNFLPNSIVHKYNGYSFSEVSGKIKELDERLWLFIFAYFHQWNETPVKVVDLSIDFLHELKSHCRFAKIIISLPFLTVKDMDFNNKILRCNILLQYSFLKDMDIILCDNSVLYNRDQAVRENYLRTKVYILINKGWVYLFQIWNTVWDRF